MSLFWGQSAKRIGFFVVTIRTTAHDVRDLVLLIKVKRRVLH